MLLSTFTVTTAAESGDGSFRQAIQFNNAAPGSNTINFAIPGTGIQTIALLSPLPTVTGAVMIDGTSQPGVLRTPAIELDGAVAGLGANGLTLSISSGGVKGLIINRFGKNGIEFQPPAAAGQVNGTTPSSVTVQRCYIGTDAQG